VSYTFLQEQGEEFSAECFSDIPASVLSRLNLIAEKSCFPVNGTEFCQSFQSGMMSSPSTENLGEEKSMSSAAASLAKTSALPINQHRLALESTEAEAVYGGTWRESWMKFDPVARSWRTHQCLWGEDLHESSVTLPKWGMTRNGVVLEATPPEIVPTANDFGCSLMRPTASDSLRQKFQQESLIRNGHPDGNLSEQLARVHQQTLTPLACEILMQWLEGWTELKPLETDKIREWLSSHGKL
jgi:hypothetical protein